ncbi:Cilia- and flagella-associated protein 36 (Coiled-coil domain-containing protein 104) [Durusdinium trenchii]|uniref:Cilia- and flagella-associated protein 36 n=1 Tax=Durusdinium trenchii TaxID=1381693 RepID=A0ABP0SD46_9DINO
MASGSAEDPAWLVDMIIQFVSSPSWNEPINSFVAEKCVIFDNLDDEMKHEYMECHQEFSGLVESLLAAHLLEVDIAPEDFERQVMESGLKDDERMQGVVSQLMAAEDFLTFRDMMLKHHMQMQQAAEGTYHGPSGMTPEEEKLANDAAIAAAIAADASTMEEQVLATAHSCTDRSEEPSAGKSLQAKAKLGLAGPLRYPAPLIHLTADRISWPRRDGPGCIDFSSLHIRPGIVLATKSHIPEISQLLAAKINPPKGGRVVAGITCLESGVGKCEPPPTVTVSSGSWGSGRELIWSGLYLCGLGEGRPVTGFVSSLPSPPKMGYTSSSDGAFVANPAQPSQISVQGIGLACWMQWPQKTGPAAVPRIRIIPQNVGCMAISEFTAAFDFRSGAASSALGCAGVVVLKALAHSRASELLRNAAETVLADCWICRRVNTALITRTGPNDFAVQLGTLSVATRRDCEAAEPCETVRVAQRCTDHNSDLLVKNMGYTAITSLGLTCTLAISVAVEFTTERDGEWEFRNWFFVLMPTKNLVAWLVFVLPGGAAAAGRQSRHELLRREISSDGDVALMRGYPQSSSCEDKMSKYECKGARGYDQSCIFHCAYLTPDVPTGRWVVTLLETKEDENDISISDWDMPAILVEKPVTVRVKRFPSKAELQDYARGWTAEHRRGLSVLFRALWQDRWAHALFDGLYPAYVSLSRFGLADHAFMPVVLLSNYTEDVDCRMLESQLLGLSGQGIFTGSACQMEEAIRLFAGKGAQDSELFRINGLWEELQGSALLFDHLLSGSAHLGEYASVLALPGIQESDDTLGRFGDRLYAALVAPRGALAAREVVRPMPSNRSTGRLQVLITANKRMLPEELLEMSKLAGLRGSGDLLMNISFVDWSKVQPFKTQLELLRRTDVLVSGIGTALFYSAFLPPNSVCINTGWRDPAQIPTYGEDVLGMSNRRSRFLYLPLEKVRRGVTPHDVEEEILHAARLIAQGLAKPSGPEENWSIFGRIMGELQRRSGPSLRGLEGREQDDGGFLCHQRPTGQTSLSDLVFERRLDAKNLLFQPGYTTLTDACQLDVALLRQIKRKYNLTEALGLPPMECECVACEACGFG